MANFEKTEILKPCLCGLGQIRLTVRSQNTSYQRDRVSCEVLCDSCRDAFNFVERRGTWIATKKDSQARHDAWTSRAPKEQRFRTTSVVAEIVADLEELALAAGRTKVQWHATIQRSDLFSQVTLMPIGGNTLRVWLEKIVFENYDEVIGRFAPDNPIHERLSAIELAWKKHDAEKPTLDSVEIRR
jgi:hypothetical protein